MLNDSTTKVLVGLLDATNLRHKVLSHNLANASTPGYLRQDIQFDRIMKEIAAGRSESVVAQNPEVFVDSAAPIGPDGNSVQLDMEMAEMSKNALLYQFSMQLLSTKMALARTAITGRT